MAMKVNPGVLNEEYAGSRVTITRPDDWHLHLRDGDAMADVLRHSAERFGRALIMPNLKPPVVTVEQAYLYRDRIVKALPKEMPFSPFMSLYLTDKTSSDEILRAAKMTKQTIAAKLYPAGATTNSDAGVTDMTKISGALEAMEEHDLVLCIHGELLHDDHGEVDIFDREKRFLEEVLLELVDSYPKLRIVFEHATTSEAIQFVESAREGVAATITAHHLLENRNVLFRGGIRPHHYCLPILKRERDREALLLAATSGSPKFFLGTDSAPHAKGTKEAACGCAGCYTAHAAIELYTEAFALLGALNRLEGFASHFGADFYGLPRNTDVITLVKQPWRVPTKYRFGADVVVPYRAGEIVHWQVEGLDYPL